VITKALSGAASPVPRIGWIFASFCILLPLTRFASEALLARVGQDALLDLRLRISRKITATPLAKLEELGSHRLLAMLTDDVPMITNAVSVIPMIASWPWAC
jgi:putative ATP-binding cassette transporter